MHLENSLEALLSAFEHGADGVEFDVQLSRDMVPMVFHDRELKRLVHVDGFIDDLDLADLRALKQSHKNYSKSYTISTLEEVLRAMPAKKIINIELKESTVLKGLEGIKKVLAVIEPYKYKLEIIISSFDQNILHLVSQIDPEYKLAFLIENNQDLQEYIAGKISFDKIDYINLHISLVSKLLSKNIKDNHVKLIIWGHKNIGEENNFINDNHMALISDIIIDLKNYYKKS
jgi:glycerophosphoryl diester phosphodiesterase